MAYKDTSWIKVKTSAGYGRLELPVDVADVADVATLVPLTLGKCETLIHNVGDVVTDAKTAAGKKYTKAVIVFKNIPTTGDDTIHRVSIPAPDLNTATGITTVDVGNKEMIPASSEATGNDGNALVAILHTALGLTGSSVFLSGNIVQEVHQQ